jgi:hypothetical protein
MHHYFYVIYDVITDVYPSARPNENEKKASYIFFWWLGQIYLGVGIIGSPPNFPEDVEGFFWLGSLFKIW